MNRIFSFVPHLLTSGNLFCGVLALVSIQNHDYFTACYLVLIAGFLDFFDGFAARMLKVSGDFGKQLDSLADMVTFGAVPAVLLYTIFNENIREETFSSGLDFLRFTPLLIAVFSGLRLAKFNIDPRQTVGFIGLNTPSNTFWIISIPFLLDEYPGKVSELLEAGWPVVIFTALSCFLLVSELRLMSLKVKGFGWKENSYVYILLLISLVLVIWLKFLALSIIIPVYIIFSLIQNTLKKS